MKRSESETESGIISQAAAARRSGITPQYLRKIILRDKPPFAVRDPITEIYMVNTKHRTWKEFEKKNLENPDRTPVKRHTNQKSMSMRSIQKALKMAGAEPDTKIDPGIKELVIQAEKAVREQEINKAKITKEKAIQEEIKTLQLKKHVAPIDLLDFYFSFSENMIQRLYRRPHEIEADLESLFLAGEKKKATQKLIRELEAIVKDVQNDLISRLKEEGYKLKGTDNAKPKK